MLTFNITIIKSLAKIYFVILLSQLGLRFEN